MQTSTKLDKRVRRLYTYLPLNFSALGWFFISFFNSSHPTANQLRGWTRAFTLTQSPVPRIEDVSCLDSRCAILTLINILSLCLTQFTCRWVSWQLLHPSIPSSLHRYLSPRVPSCWDLLVLCWGLFEVAYRFCYHWEEEAHHLVLRLDNYKISVQSM